jgi:hypothetical protein
MPALQSHRRERLFQAAVGKSEIFENDVPLLLLACCCTLFLRHNTKKINQRQLEAS